MDELQVITRQERDFDERMRSIDLAQAYIMVTQEHGPSHQLISFINHNRDFGKEIGLESFNNFSLQVQHEIFLSKLNIEELDSLALESLATRLHTMSSWLMGAGAAGFGSSWLAFLAGASDKTQIIVGGIGLSAILAGMILRAGNNYVNGVIKASDFKKFEGAFDRYIREELLISNQIPSTDDTEAWNRYMKIQLGEEAKKAITSLINTFTPIDIKQPAPSSTAAKRLILNAELSVSHIDGWDEKTFTSATKWMLDTVKKVHGIEIDYSEKLKKLDIWVSSEKAAKDPHAREKFRTVSDALSKQFASFVESRRILKWAEHELNRVGKLFEEKK